MIAWLVSLRHHDADECLVRLFWRISTALVPIVWTGLLALAVWATPIGSPAFYVTGVVAPLMSTLICLGYLWVIGALGQEPRGIWRR